MKKTSRILVTGGSGLIGSAVLRILVQNGFTNILAPTHSDLNLLRQESVHLYFDKNKPEYVFHLAAKVGGIYANAKFPANFIYQNTIMQANIFEAAYHFNVQKLLFPGSACTYPKLAPQPIQENQLGTGPIEVTNIAYGLAKLNGIIMAKSYFTQYGLPCIVPMPTNTFGIGDNFDPAYSHVIPALMLRIHEAMQRDDHEVIIWGTGSPLREFIYSDDVARAFIFLMQEYNVNEHINVGTMEEISIRDLAMMICNITGYKGRIRFDETKPDGAPRKILDSSNLFQMGWKPLTSLRNGLIAMHKHHFTNY
jgi:GDP-L-fucose synthase